MSIFVKCMTTQTKEFRAHETYINVNQIQHLEQHVSREGAYIVKMMGNYVIHIDEGSFIKIKKVMVGLRDKILKTNDWKLQ